MFLCSQDWPWLVIYPYLTAKCWHSGCEPPHWWSRSCTLGKHSIKNLKFIRKLRIVPTALVHPSSICGNLCPFVCSAGIEPRTYLIRDIQVLYHWHLQLLDSRRTFGQICFNIIFTDLQLPKHPWAHEGYCALYPHQNLSFNTNNKG